MAKIYERLLSTNVTQEKRRDSFDLRNVNLSGEDSIWMANRLEIPRIIHCFFWVLFHD